MKNGSGLVIVASSGKALAIYCRWLLSAWKMQ
jgi:hypothetical protein